MILTCSSSKAAPTCTLHRASPFISLIERRHAVWENVRKIRWFFQGSSFPSWRKALAACLKGSFSFNCSVQVFFGISGDVCFARFLQTLLNSRPHFPLLTWWVTSPPRFFAQFTLSMLCILNDYGADSLSVPKTLRRPLIPLV